MASVVKENPVAIITRDRLKQLFANIENGRVLVYGDLMLDQYLWGKVDRISPEAPVQPVVEVESESILLGGAANVAKNIAAIGCGVEIAGLVGDDPNATRMKHMLEREGIGRHRLSVDQKRPTTLKTRIIAHNQQVVRADRESRAEIDGYTEKEMIDYIESRMDDINCLLISDYGKGAITAALLERVVDLARKKRQVCCRRSQRDPFPQLPPCFGDYAQ